MVKIAYTEEEVVQKKRYVLTPGTGALIGGVTGGIVRGVPGMYYAGGLGPALRGALLGGIGGGLAGSVIGALAKAKRDKKAKQNLDKQAGMGTEEEVSKKKKSGLLPLSGGLIGGTIGAVIGSRSVPAAAQPLPPWVKTLTPKVMNPIINEPIYANPIIAEPLRNLQNGANKRSWKPTNRWVQGAVAGGIAGSVIGAIAKSRRDKKAKQNLDKQAGFESNLLAGLMAYPAVTGAVIGSRRNKIEKQPIPFNGGSLPLKDLRNLESTLTEQVVPSGIEVWDFFNSLPTDVRESMTVGEFDDLFVKATNHKLKKTAGLGLEAAKGVGSFLMKNVGIGAGLGGLLGLVTGARAKIDPNEGVPELKERVTALQGVRERGLSSMKELERIPVDWDPYSGADRTSPTPAYMLPVDYSYDNYSYDIYPTQAEHNVALERGLMRPGDLGKRLQYLDRDRPLMEYLNDIKKEMEHGRERW